MGIVRTKRSIFCRRPEGSDQPAIVRCGGCASYTPNDPAYRKYVQRPNLLRDRQVARPQRLSVDEAERSAAPAAPEAAATPEATAGAPEATATGPIASRADAPGATEVARALRAVDARAAIGVQLAERSTRDARLRRAVTRLR